MRRKKILPRLAFLFEDDLREHRARDVFARLGIENRELLARFHHRSEIVQRHISARARMVEAPVRVFLDGDGLAGRICLFGHGLKLPRFWRASSSLGSTLGKFVQSENPFCGRPHLGWRTKG